MKFTTYHELGKNQFPLRFYQVGIFYVSFYKSKKCHILNSKIIELARKMQNDYNNISLYWSADFFLPFFQTILIKSLRTISLISFVCKNRLETNFVTRIPDTVYCELVSL